MSELSLVLRLRCVRFQSNWLLTLPCRGVMDVVLALIGRELKCLKQGKDVTVMRDELER